MQASLLLLPARSACEWALLEQRFLPGSDTRAASQDGFSHSFSLLLSSFLLSLSAGFCFRDPWLPLCPSPLFPFFLPFFPFLVFSLHLFFSLLSFLSSSAFFQSQQGWRIQIDPLPASNVIEALCGSCYLYGNYQGGLESGGRPNAPTHILLFLLTLHTDHMGLTAHLKLLIIKKNKCWCLRVLKWENWPHAWAQIVVGFSGFWKWFLRSELLSLAGLLLFSNHYRAVRGLFYGLWK